MSKFIKLLAFLYFLANIIVCFLIALFAATAWMSDKFSPGYAMIVVPITGVLAGYWIRNSRFGWWRNLVIGSNIIVTAAVLFTAIFFAPGLKKAKQEKFELNRILEQNTSESKAEKVIAPVLKGKDPLPGSHSNHGIESLDDFGEAPVKEEIKQGIEMQGRLLGALGMDDIPQVRYLISKGAEVNQPFSAEGDTPLMLAQSLAMARILVLEGANVNARDARNGTVLHYAVTRPAARELVPFLIESGALISARGWGKETPFNLAVIHLNETRAEDMGIIELLVALGADINAPNSGGYTGLMQAAAMNNSPLVELLLSLGADKTLTNPDGRTAKDIAHESGSRYVYRILE